MSTNRTEKTNLPVNKPYLKSDLRLGEDAIANAPIFLENSLVMYADVPLIDLFSIDEPDHFAADRDDVRIDYLICRGDDVIMAIDVDGSGDALKSQLYVPNLLFAETNVLAMEQGLTDNIIELLEDLLCADFHPSWKCQMYECSTEQIDQLIDARLVESRSLQLLPTEYGIYEGLVTIIKPGNHRSAQYSYRVSEKLRQMFYSEEDFENARFVHKLSKMPLYAYMEDCPQFFDKLKAHLPASCCTYGEAAEAIYRMLQDGRRDAADKGTMLMLTLALPLYNQASANIEECRTVLGGHALPYDARVEKWDTHMAALKQSDPFRWMFLTIGLGEFFDGVAFCTGLNYPRWLVGMITAYHEDRLDRCSEYSRALCFAYEKASSAALDQDDGIRLLYQLTIEPFHLLRQKRKVMERFNRD